MPHLPQGVLEGLREDVGGRALGLRDQDIERLRRDAVVRDRAREQELADLRAVAVDDHELIVELEQGQHRLRRCGGDRLLLLGRALAAVRIYGIAPDGDDQSPGKCEWRVNGCRSPGEPRNAGDPLLGEVPF